LLAIADQLGRVADAQHFRAAHGHQN
jgi:hypothetical protein